MALGGTYLHSCVLVTVVLAGTTVQAQPVTRPEHEPCKVTIALAPAEVRDEIEAWVRAEPRCERELEVRVVPTEEGLYLSARDPQGRVRERVVPDAQSVAVLVVSWMADDSLGPTLPAPEEPEPATEERAAPALASDDEMPGALAPEPVAEGTSLRRGQPHRWLTLGALASPHEHVGLRAQLDLFGGRRWSVGLAGGWRSRDDHGDTHGGTGQVRLVVSAGRSFGRISLRAQLGLGADLSSGDDRMEGRDSMERRHDGALEPMAEAGVLVKVRVTDTWGLIGGPVVEATLGDHGSPTPSVFLGVQRGL